ncbi:MAG TPA: P27 family phage terminase small subunit [Methylomirabilota bacterium]|jgi:P27 family predicted phage terminase small subunit|nr:P27 family phage terminase small subunit [Methylomirabilota bacterium]
MGRRGKKPKPSALDKLDGGAGHRHRNRNEPKPPASEAMCPAWLLGDRVARAIWDAEAPGMIRLGLLTTADRMIFAALCERAALYRRASQRLRRAKRGADALTDVTRSNGRVARPEVGIAKGALEGLRQLAAAFGMTPADRKGLEVDLGAGAAREQAGKGKPGQAVDIDEFVRRREARRAERAE